VSNGGGRGNSGNGNGNGGDPKAADPRCRNGDRT
jgi:hypothetical protein